MIGKVSKNSVGNSEYSDAIFKSTSYKLKDYDINLIVYPDIVIFYSFFIEIVVIGLLS